MTAATTMTQHHPVYAEALAAIGPGIWYAGDWTPARCCLWRGLNDEGRQRLDDFVAREKDRPWDRDLNRIKPYDHQLPDEAKLAGLWRDA